MGLSVDRRDGDEDGVDYSCSPSSLFLEPTNRVRPWLSAVDESAAPELESKPDAPGPAPAFNGDDGDDSSGEHAQHSASALRRGGCHMTELESRRAKTALL